MNPNSTPVLSYAGFWIRLIADAIDSILLDIVTCLILLMGFGTAYWVKHLSSGADAPSFFEAFDSFTVQIIMAGIRIVLAFGYFSYATYRYGTTLGKKPFGIYVVSYPQENATDLTDPDAPLLEVAPSLGKHHKVLRDSAFVPVTKKNSVIRSAAYALSYLPFGTGFFMVLFHPEKRALHDLLAGTVSIISKPPEKAQT